MKLHDRPILSIIIPTIDGREHWLARALESFANTYKGAEYLIYENRPTCGMVWNEGISRATGDYILLAADDLEAHPGWWQAGVEALDAGVIPCPRILNPDGTIQSCGNYAKEASEGTPAAVARVPFLTRELALEMYPIFENQYMGDYWISWWGWQKNIPTRVVRKMVFTHHYAMEGRINSLYEDKQAYQKAIQ